MTLGKASQQLDLLDPVSRFCAETLPANSIYTFLHEHRDRLFPDSLFTDLFAQVGRRSVPPSVVAAVMVLQRLEGLSDREAVDRFAFDVRWRYAAGVGGWDGAARAGFAHTVLVDMRERLRRSDRPDRFFEVALAAAGQAGLIGRKRVLDSTPLYDAVATMDTITLIRSAVRGLLSAAGRGLAGELRAVLTSGDDYTSTGKPVTDWDDKSAREALIDSRARDGYALLAALTGRKDLPEPVPQAMTLLATVLGQDLETGDDGILRIARKVATDRVISTIDLGAGTVTCPNQITTAIRPITGHDRNAGRADFGKACTNCPLRAQCTASKTGRQITISRWETHLATGRTRQTDPAWKADYRATRPKVERKLAHLMRRRHGGRRARMRGLHRVAADFTLLAAATNLARLATLNLTHQPGGWAIA